MWIARNKYKKALGDSFRDGLVQRDCVRKELESKMTSQLRNLRSQNNHITELEEECKLMNEHARDTYDSWVRRTDELTNAQDKIVELERELEKTKRSLSTAEKGNIRLNAKLKELQQ